MPLSELGQRGLGAGLGTQGERGLRVKEVPGPQGRGAVCARGTAAGSGVFLAEPAAEIITPLKTWQLNSSAHGNKSTQHNFLVKMTLGDAVSQPWELSASRVGSPGRPPEPPSCLCRPDAHPAAPRPPAFETLLGGPGATSARCQLPPLPAPRRHRARAPVLPAH